MKLKLFTLLTFILFACSEDDVNEIQTNTLPCKVKTFFDDDGGSISTFEYDNQGKLIQVHDDNTDIQLIYEGPRLEKANYNNIPDNDLDPITEDIISFFYDNSGIVNRITYTDASNNETWLESRFFYSNGIIDRIEHWRPYNSPDLVKTEEYIFTVENNNVIKYEKISHDYHDAIDVIVTITYDNKNNIFFKQNSFYLFWGSYENYFSQNNSVKIETYNIEQDYTYSSENIMEYNAYDFPTKRSFYRDGTLDYTSYITYECQ